jgi:hypothetical protein
MVASDLKLFGKVTDVKIHRAGKKALVTFAYNDSALKAVNSSGSLVGFTLKRAMVRDVAKFKENDSKPLDAIQRLKQQFGVLHIPYKNGYHEESIEDLEQSIRLICNKRANI